MIRLRRADRCVSCNSDMRPGDRASGWEDGAVTYLACLSRGIDRFADETCLRIQARRRGRRARSQKQARQISSPRWRPRATISAAGGHEHHQHLSSIKFSRSQMTFRSTKASSVVRIAEQIIASAWNRGYVESSASQFLHARFPAEQPGFISSFSLLISSFVGTGAPADEVEGETSRLFRKTFGSSSASVIARARDGIEKQVSPFATRLLMKKASSISCPLPR